MGKWEGMYDLLSTNRLLEYGKVNQYPVIAQLVERETVVVLIAGISRSLVRVRFAGFSFVHSCHYHYLYRNIYETRHKIYSEDSRWHQCMAGHRIIERKPIFLT